MSQYPDRSQHWHHLTPEQQQEFDQARAGGLIGGVGQIGNFVRLEDHNLDLFRLLSAYDGLFKERDLLISPPSALPPDWYAKRVLVRWAEYLNGRGGLGLRATPAITAIEKELVKGAGEAWRRRNFFTRIERIEQTHPKKDSESLKQLMLEIKTLVINAAFYDEFEQFKIEDAGALGSIAAVRDLSGLWLQRDSPESMTAEPLLTADVAALDLLQVSDIVSFHTEPGYQAFQGSIGRLHDLQLRALRPNPDEIESAVSDHLTILRDCAKSAIEGRGLKSPMEGAIADVFLGTDPAIAAMGISALSLAAGVPTAIAVSVNLVFAVLLRKKARTHGWCQIESVLERVITDELEGS